MLFDTELDSPEISDLQLDYCFQMYVPQFEIRRNSSSKLQTLNLFNTFTL